MLYEVLVLGGAAFGAHAAAVLKTVFRQRGTLDIAGVGNGDDHVLVGVEILGVEFIGRRYDLGPAGISVFFLEFLSLLLDKGILQGLVGQKCGELLDQSHHCIIVGTQLLTVHTGELSQTHFHDSTGLYLCEAQLCA